MFVRKTGTMKIKSDMSENGKSYPKLDAYSGGNYLGSSIQFRTKTRFKLYMEHRYPGKKITVEKGSK